MDFKKCHRLEDVRKRTSEDVDKEKAVADLIVQEAIDQKSYCKIVMQPTTDSILWMSGTPATAAMAPTTRTVSKWATTPVMTATTAATASRSPVPHEVLQDDLFVHEDAVTRSSSTTSKRSSKTISASKLFNDHFINLTRGESYFSFHPC